MIKSIAGLSAVTLFLASSAMAEGRDDIRPTATVQVEELTGLEAAFEKRKDQVRNPRRTWRAARTSSTLPPPDPWSNDYGPFLTNNGDILLDKIITIGETVWKIVDSNRPVAETSFKAGTALLPEGAKSWTQLAGWETPATRLYRVTYKNRLGMTMIDFSFRVAYTYGGSVEGKGKYLANIELEPAAIDVAWGYKFSADGLVMNPHNGGTSEDPIAASEIRIHWTINNVLKTSQKAERFFLRGDGLFKNLSNGTLPAQ